MTPGRSATILIIDDSPEDRETYQAFLQQFPDYFYTFLEEEDAERGLLLCREVEIDCILLDYNLPGMDGIEFLARLGGSRERIKPPVVVITGRGSEAVAVQSLKSGAADYLIKSDLTPESLYRATLNAIHLDQARRRLEHEERERREAEADLRASEERFRLLVEAARDFAIVMLDRDGCVESWNSGARRILRYHDSEVIGQSYRKLFTSEDVRRGLPEDELQRVGGDGQLQTERWQVRRDGERFWASSTLNPIRDSLGELKGFSLIIRDMTEKKAHEDSLRNQQRWLESVLDAAPTAMLLVAPATGEVLFTNRAARALADPECLRRLFSRDEGAAPGTECTEEDGSPVEPGDLPGARATRGEKLSGRRIRLNPPGKSIPLLVYTETLPAAHGHQGVVVMSLIDLTGLPRREAAHRNAIRRMKDAG